MSSLGSSPCPGLVQETRWAMGWMWGWGNAGRSKNCSLLPVGKISGDRLGGKNWYLHCINAPWAMSLLNAPLQKRTCTIIQPDLVPVLPQLIWAVPQRRTAFGGGSLCRQEVGTATEPEKLLGFTQWAVLWVPLPTPWADLKLSER